MLSTAILSMMVNGSVNQVTEVTKTYSDGDWTRQAAPGTNPPGFTAWHMARAIDWAVNTGIRNVPELATTAEFRSMGPELGIGLGTTQDEAVDIARRMSRDAVRDYVAAVGGSVLAWLGEVDEALLVAPGQLRQHQEAFAPYRSDAHIAEVSDLFDVPNWHLVARPAVSHIRVHYGELEVVGQLMRG